MHRVTETESVLLARAEEAEEALSALARRLEEAEAALAAERNSLLLLSRGRERDLGALTRANTRLRGLVAELLAVAEDSPHGVGEDLLDRVLSEIPTRGRR